MRRLEGSREHRLFIGLREWLSSIQPRPPVCCSRRNICRVPGCSPRSSLRLLPSTRPRLGARVEVPPTLAPQSIGFIGLLLHLSLEYHSLRWWRPSLSNWENQCTQITGFGTRVFFCTSYIIPVLHHNKNSIAVSPMLSSFCHHHTMKPCPLCKLLFYKD